MSFPTPLWTFSTAERPGDPICQGAVNQARKKSTKINFLGPETARWGRGLPCEGVVAENFVPSLESLSSLGFEERNPGCPRNFAGMSRTPGGVQKLRAKKVRSHFAFPSKGGLSQGAQCAKQTFLQRNGLPSAVVTRHPLGLGTSVQSQPGLGSRTSHLQAQMPQRAAPASASSTGQAIDLYFERSPFKSSHFRASTTLRIFSGYF